MGEPARTPGRGRCSAQRGRAGGGGSQAIAFTTPFTGHATLPAVVATSADPVCAATVSGMGNAGFTLSVARRDGRAAGLTSNDGVR